MEDFDYLAHDSNAAWLDGRGDGRFERYERFYHSERALHADQFNLEKLNEEYVEWSSRQSPRLLGLISASWVGRVAVTLFSVYMASKLVPSLAGTMPYATGAMLVVVFLGLRVFHWRHKRR